jgi:Asp-tRNA(Asn)/Glu-tRNA(Gln) amidotransferase A subunit family amidase
LRVAVLLNDGGGAIDSQIRSAFEGGLDMLSNAGAQLEEIELPWVAGMLGEHVQIGEEAEVAADYGHYFDGRERLMSATFRTFVASGLRRSAADLQRSRRAIMNGLHQVERALQGYDLLVSPTLSVFPPPAGAELLELLRLTTLWDLNGWPAISVPVALSQQQLPIGFQIVGRPWSEALLLRAARVIEQSCALPYPPPALADSR